MVTLYTNHCRKCEILKSKLMDKNVNFKIVDDEQWLRENGYDFMPVLEVDGNKFGYLDAVNYVNSL